MSNAFLNTENLPFCKGCGHSLIAKNTTGALKMLEYDPLDVIIVTDIGCHGIIDKALNTHTVHGLHGRSAALGAGISFGSDNPEKKIIVFIGDGGATIGLQHIMEAARLNINMTVVVHNNYLYGMTGGQTSGFTPVGFNTTTSGEGNPFGGYDICKLTHSAGASYVSRITGIGDISDALAEAFAVKGFSLVEVLELCPSYGMKLNPKRKLTEIIQSAGMEMGVWRNLRDAYIKHQGRKTQDLFHRLTSLEQQYKANLDKNVSVVISGSAGEGVQLAAGLLSKAAINSGLQVTQKGSYPVTVGVGFSTAEVYLSPHHINFHGIDIPDIAIITSEDGLAHNRKRIGMMKSGLLIIDSSLSVPHTGAEVISYDFRGIGARNASVFAVLYFALHTGYISTQSILNIIELEGKSDKLPIEGFKDALEKIKIP